LIASLKQKPIAFWGIVGYNQFTKNQLGEIMNYPVYNLVGLDDSDYYIERPCDAMLYDLLNKGKYCHILAPRKSGKTSLIVKTADKLRKNGVEAIDISCLAFESKTYGVGFIYELVQSSSLMDILSESDIDNFLSEVDLYDNLIKIDQFFEDVLLPNIKTPIVIFVDNLEEIDSVVREQFVTFVRSVSERSKGFDSEEYSRITFCLSGVFSFAGYRCPYNIGNKIHLDNFTINNFKSNQFYDSVDSVVIEKVLEWTDGQPYLTMLSLHLLEKRNVSPEVLFEQAVEQGLSIYSQWAESYLQRCYARIMNKANKEDLIQCYGQVLAGEKVTNSRLIEELYLFGLVSRSNVVPKLIREILNYELFTFNLSKS
jgi:hypothetical protein